MTIPHPVCSRYEEVTLNTSVGGGRTLSAVTPECRLCFAGARVCLMIFVGLIHSWKAYWWVSTSLKATCVDLRVFRISEKSASRRCRPRGSVVWPSTLPTDAWAPPPPTSTHRDPSIRVIGLGVRALYFSQSPFFTLTLMTFFSPSRPTRLLLGGSWGRLCLHLYADC